MSDIDLKKSFKNFINSNENKRFINETFKDIINAFGVNGIVLALNTARRFKEDKK